MGDPGGTTDEGESPTLPPGTHLGKYEIVRLLGAGGMGAVYEARHLEIGKRVAIKVLSPLIVAVPGARARFLREAQLTSRVRHPHIVDVADMGTDAGQTYIVMELLSGEDLSQRLHRLGPLGPEELADIMLPVFAAVAAAHQAGITHRDLKPQNIFLASDGRRVHPKVLDFGISKGNDGTGAAGVGTLTATGAMVGTPFYLAPEQIIDSRTAGPASDQYGLGVILYECLTGQLPFGGENLFGVFQRIVAGAPPRPRELRPDLPPALEDVILRAINKEPAARFPSLAEFGQALLPFASHRARLTWDEVFVGGGVPVPGLSLATPGPALATPTPGAGRAMAPWSSSPMPSAAGRPTPTPPLQPSPSFSASAGGTLIAPVGLQDGASTATMPARDRKWLVVGAAVLVAGALAGFIALRGAATTPAPAVAPALVPRSRPGQLASPPGRTSCPSRAAR
jgi:serine/threonine protein kinase